jgi:hypothetical protein
MDRKTIFLLRLLATVVAMPGDGRAEPRGLPDDLLGIITAPIGAIFDTVEQFGRASQPRAPIRSSRSSTLTASPRKAHSSDKPTSHTLTATTDSNAREAPIRPIVAVVGNPDTTGTATADRSSTQFSTNPAETVPPPLLRQQNAVLDKSVNERKGRTLNSEVSGAENTASPKFETSPFGVVGPLAWPHAFEDVVGFTLWPKLFAARLREHGIGDILTTIFAPGAVSALRSQSKIAKATAIGPNRAPVPTAGSPGSCDTAEHQTPDWPANEIQHLIELTTSQRNTLDQLKTAIIEAVTAIKTTCNNAAATTPTGRAQEMRDVLWAVRDAAILVRRPLSRFYDSLSDDHKKQFVVATTQTDPRTAPTGGAVDREAIARMCGMPNMSENSMRPIERTLQPTAAQKVSLETLQKKSFEMGQLLILSCLQPAAATPPERLDFAIDRLTGVLFAVLNINLAFNDLYNQLSDEQRTKLAAFAR